MEFFFFFFFDVLAFVITPIPFSACQAFNVFHSTQGAQGKLGQASHQQLDTCFGTHKDVDVVTFILNNGKVQHGDAIVSSGTLNIARGSAVDQRA